MKNTAYSEKLKDPRWQKRRLEIFNRDEWTCQKCGGKETTLHLHHRYYLAGKEPWEAPDNALSTLCGECHDIEHEKMKSVSSDLVLIMKQSGLWADDFYEIATGFIHMSTRFIPEVTAAIIGRVLQDDKMIEYLFHEYSSLDKK
ncbi:MAG: hypothetical protein OEV64_09210 [Desulfobulbaceae bacterium]|nr:hypothetical protein [Desulfobulbaceae bacterium]